MEKNNDIVRQLYDAFGKGDLPAVLGAFDPQVQWREAENFLYADGNPYVDTRQWTQAKPSQDEMQVVPQTALQLIVNLYKAIFYFGNYSVMALDYETDDGVVYGPRTRALLGNIPLFVYHIPDDVALLLELSALPQIRVLLDHDHGANHYRLTACAKNRPPVSGVPSLHR